MAKERRGHATAVSVTFGSDDVTVSNGAETRIHTLGREQYPNTDELIDAAARDEAWQGTVGVNPRYFAQVLQACEIFAGGPWFSATRLEATGDVKPLRFEVHRGDDRFVGLLMPLRISGGTD